MIRLLDINVLIAFAWPSHVHHQRTRERFARQQHAGWATCPPTETGFVRLSSHPVVVDPPLTPAEAGTAMSALREMPQHEFWTDDTAAASIDWSAVTTFGHVPDAHLVAVANRNGGRVATLDRRLVERFGDDAATLVT